MKTSSPESVPPQTVSTWYRLGVADLIFLAVALLVLRGARFSMLDDPGLGWHLRNIDAMVAQGWWLTSDPFTEPGPEGPRPHLTNQWLGELPYWLGWRWGGLEGIAVVNALLIAFTMRLLYRMLLADGAPWPVAAFWTVVIAVGTSCSWTARPNVLTILFVLLTARIGILFHEGRLSRLGTLWLLPLLALWANCHGGFVAGLVILTVCAGCELACAVFSLEASDRRAARSRAIHLILLGAGGFLATLLNPYGLRLYSWIFQLLGDPFFMDLHQEWRSPDFHGAGAMRFELLILLFPLLLGLTSRRPHLVELILAVVWLHFALTGFRYVALWVVVAGPLLARSSLEIRYLQEAAHRLGLTGPDSLFQTRADPAPWAWSGAFLVVLLGWAHLAQGTFAAHQSGILATSALDRFLEIHREQQQVLGRRPKIFHSYDWGGYLTWHGWPEVLNWIDDRNEVQGKARIQDYFTILRTDPGWQEKLEQTQADLICIEAGAPLTQRLSQSPAWKELYRDKSAVIFQRVQP